MPWKGLRLWRRRGCEDPFEPQFPHPLKVTERIRGNASAALGAALTTVSTTNDQHYINFKINNKGCHAGPLLLP